MAQHAQPDRRPLVGGSPSKVVSSKVEMLGPHAGTWEFYQLLGRLGEGTYGVVYQARRKDADVMVAIKEIKMDDQLEEGVQTASLREISLLLDLQHPNIVKLHEVLSDRFMHKVYMVLEFMDVDLHRFVRKAPQLMPNNPHLVKYYMWQLAQGLAYCHSRRVVHRDIKPQNLLIDFATNHIKIADFGLARTMGVPVRCLSPEVVTIWYRPPEVLMCSRAYTAAVDVWSLGCVFYEMTASRPLFAGSGEIDQMSRIFSVLGVPTEDTWPGVSELPGFRGVSLMANQPQRSDGLYALAGNIFTSEGLDLLGCMLQLDPAKRITARDVLRHPYFRDIQDILNNPPRLLFN